MLHCRFLPEDCLYCSTQITSRASETFQTFLADEGLREIISTENEGRLRAPALLEQYVNHGTCLFKVYVLGNQELMVTRPSLNLHKENNDASQGLRPPIEYIDRVSAYPTSKSWGDNDLAPKGHGVPLPPEWLWKGAARTLQSHLGLTIFNFDIIVPLEPPAGQRGLVEETEKEGLVYLIDINYYPGVEKLENSEQIIVNFLNSLRHNNPGTSECIS